MLNSTIVIYTAHQLHSIHFNYCCSAFFAFPTPKHNSNVQKCIWWARKIIQSNGFVTFSLCKWMWCIDICTLRMYSILIMIILSARTNVKCSDFPSHLSLVLSKANIINLSHGLSLRFLYVMCAPHAGSLVYFQPRYWSNKITDVF